MDLTQIGHGGTDVRETCVSPTGYAAAIWWPVVADDSGRSGLRVVKSLRAIVFRRDR